MVYRFATEAEDYSDFAAGRVLYALPGQTAFPVRLTDEIWGRFIALRSKRGLDTGRITIYDPCCGGAYQLTTLALRHGQRIKQIYAADLDPDAIALANKNLGLLQPAGRQRRQSELQTLWATYGKQAHADALISLENLSSHSEQQDIMTTTLFKSDIAHSTTQIQQLNEVSIDLVLCDLPYGDKAHWLGKMAGEPAGSLHTFLNHLLPLTNPNTILALAMSKKQKAIHEAFRPLGRFQVGKRRIQFLGLISHGDDHLDLNTDLAR